MAIAIYQDLQGRQHWADSTSENTHENLADGSWVLFDDTPGSPPPAPADPFDSEMDERFANPASASSVRLRAASDARYAKGSLAVLPLRNVSVTVSTIQPVDVLTDGWLYGAAGTVIHRSNDSGKTWTQVVDVGSGTQVKGVRDLGNGEVLVLTQTGPLKRSVGWAANKATATFVTAVANPGVTYFLPFGVHTNPTTGRALATTYVASGDWTDSSKVWLSEDHGVTWTVVFDLAVDRPSVDNSGAHMHLCAIDPWADDRLWIAYHDLGPNREVLWSDDLGETWNTLTNQFQPTVGVPTDKGMVFGSDEGPNGIYVAPRTADPADMTYTLAWEWRGPVRGIMGFAQRGFRDPATGLVYMAFIGNVGYSPVIGVSDGLVGSEVWRGVPATTNGDGGRNVTVHEGKVVAHILDQIAATNSILRGTPALGGRDARTHDDPGWVLGGTATNDGSTATGVRSSATGVDATALGRGASASGTDSTAVGAGAAVSNSNSTGVGADAVATSNGTSLGARANAGSNCVAVGVDSTASSLDATSVGRDTWTRSKDVAIGRLAKQTNTAGGTGGTAVGYDAQVASGSIGLGISTRANVQDATALGARAAAAHTRSVALGSDTTTTAVDQVEIGGRHVELTELAADPAAPAANGVRWFARDNGAGKTQVCYRFATGAVVVIATEP